MGCGICGYPCTRHQLCPVCNEENDDDDAASGSCDQCGVDVFEGEELCPSCDFMAMAANQSNPPRHSANGVVESREIGSCQVGDSASSLRELAPAKATHPDSCGNPNADPEGVAPLGETLTSFDPKTTHWLPGGLTPDNEREKNVKYRPTGNYILVSSDWSVLEKKVVPKFIECKVVAVGPGDWNYERTARHPVEVKAGQVVLVRKDYEDFSRFIDDGEQKYLLVQDGDIVAVVN